MFIKHSDLLWVLLYHHRPLFTVLGEVGDGGWGAEPREGQVQSGAWARLSRHTGASYPCPPSILSQWFKQTVEGLATGKESLSRTSHRSSW